MNKSSKAFELISDYKPSGDQPQAIEELCKGIHQELRDQVLLGVTGSGKTYTMAQIIQSIKRPAVIMAPNKTLAAQLFAEMKNFFPHNAVEYFVSYYDYYQPEAYVPRSDTYIEKTASINEQIDRMRHSATRSLIERDDVIVVASVSCIYGMGGVDSYSAMTLNLKIGQEYERLPLYRRLTELQYKRNDIAFERGTFRVRGDVLDIYPAHLENRSWRILFFGDEVESILEIDALTGEKYEQLSDVTIYANSHYVTPGHTIQKAIKEIQADLKIKLHQLNLENKLLEAQRLEQRVNFDIEMMAATGSCSGIENYSRYLTGRAPGQPPPTLFEYIPQNSILFVDESHVTVPQVGGMFKGDRARKITLTEHGFRLPSCQDNRPLMFEEWNQMRPQTIFVSATPGPFELTQTHGVFTEQIIRPTGLIDPICHIHPCEHQVDDLIHHAKETIKEGYRVLVTTLTKKMAEALTGYLSEANMKVTYLHSDIDTLERIKIIHQLRSGEVDVLVGINLLREGLDIPECALVAILDADKEGFLRSRTSLIQTIGRAARNVNGKVILYADSITNSMKEALEETERRRSKQIEYNQKYGIIPQSTKRSLDANLPYDTPTDSVQKTSKGPSHNVRELEKTILQKEKEMRQCAEELNFEKAAQLRDEIKALQQQIEYN